jgi:hypothetical protein
MCKTRGTLIALMDIPEYTVIYSQSEQGADNYSRLYRQFWALILNLGSSSQKVWVTEYRKCTVCGLNSPAKQFGYH